MTKTLNQIIFFFLHQNQNIFFSNIGNQNICLEKKHNPPTPFNLNGRSPSFNAFLISLIGLHFRCLSFRVVLVNTARPDGAFLFVV